MARRITLTLPVMPPPLSACFVNVARNGRKDSPRYKEFKQAADGHLAKHCTDALGTPYKAKLSGDVWAVFTIVRPDKRVRDLDNLCKSLADLLTRNFVIEDDSRIIDLRIRWATEAQEHPVVIHLSDPETGRRDETNADLMACIRTSKLEAQKAAGVGA